MNNGYNTLSASVTGDYILTFTNCTIIDNVSDYTCNLNGNIIFKNNILRNDCDYEIKLADWSPSLVSELSVSYCNIQGGQNAIYNQNGANIVNWLEGNIDEDPLFFWNTGAILSAFPPFPLHRYWHTRYNRFILTSLGSASQ